MADKDLLKSLTGEFNNIATSCGLELRDEPLRQMVEYLLLVDEANKSFNLTNVDLTKGIIIHLLDSVYPLRLLNFPENSKVLDVGTGAGFPAVPIAIYRNDLRVFALDDTLKKVTFVNSAVQRVGISNVSAIHGRAEEFGKKAQYREQFYVVVARALAELGVLIELCAPFVAVGGSFIAYKGPESSEERYEEIQALCGLELVKKHSFELPSQGGQRLLFEFVKRVQTPNRFPRSMKRILKEHSS